MSNVFLTFLNLFSCKYPSPHLFLGRVHATDYSNASSTGIFDSYQVGWTPCYLPFYRSVCLVYFFFTSA